MLLTTLWECTQGQPDGSLYGEGQGVMITTEGEHICGEDRDQAGSELAELSATAALTI